MTRHFARPEDRPEAREDGDALPGVFPYTRGIQPTMYRGRLWTMRQYAGFGTAAESNARYRYLLAQGVSGLSVAFDLPTQMGYDSDHPMAAGEVGRVGVAIDSIEDMAVLLRRHPARPRVDVDDDQRDGDHPARALRRRRQRQGVPLDKLSGTIQNDILKEYIARGTYIYPPRHSLRIVTDIFAWCERELPNWNTISISGYHIREAGSTAVQEVAFTIANAIAYVEAARAAGLDVDTLGQRLSFFFAAHNDFLEEVAKFRAARRLWAHVMRDRFGATNPRAMQLRFHTQTAGSTLTAQQPDNNIVRVAMQALAAVLGGTQSLHCNGRDEALALPTEDAARIALRTQQIIAAESGVANTVDPLGGAWAIEKRDRRDRSTRRARSSTQSTPAGGTLAAIESGLDPAPDSGRRLCGAAGHRPRRAASSSASTAIRPTSRPRSSCCASIRRASARQADGGRGAARRAATRRPGSTRSTRVDGSGARAAPTWCRRCSPRSKRAPRSARLPTRCGASSASIVTIHT